MLLRLIGWAFMAVWIGSIVQTGVGGWKGSGPGGAALGAVAGAIGAWLFVLIAGVAFVLAKALSPRPQVVYVTRRPGRHRAHR